jgi:hypothetical protein
MLTNTNADTARPGPTGIGRAAGSRRRERRMCHEVVLRVRSALLGRRDGARQDILLRQIT